MTPHIPENISTWLVDWSLVAITDNTSPPRDPNHDDDEDEEDEEQIEPIASMRVWIESGKEDWRRPLRASPRVLFVRWSNAALRRGVPITCRLGDRGGAGPKRSLPWGWVPYRGLLQLSCLADRAEQNRRSRILRGRRKTARGRFFVGEPVAMRRPAKVPLDRMKFPLCLREGCGTLSPTSFRRRSRDAWRRSCAD
jgi:hypothetical protein